MPAITEKLPVSEFYGMMRYLLQRGDCMLLIVGGSFQGKKQIARELAEERNRTGGEGGRWTVIPDFHQRIREYLQAHPGEGREALRAFARRTVQENPDAVITLDEVGCGVVPVDREEREYREAVGAAGQELAALAGEVYRVTAGIPVRIK